jgi:hypothetical protein
MAVTDAQLREILLANPNVSDEKLAKAMDRYNVSPSQLQSVLSSMGSKVTPQTVQSRYETGGGTTYVAAPELSPVSSSGPALGLTGKDAVAKTVENSLFNSLVSQGAVQAGPFVFNPVATALQVAYNLYKNLSDKKKAESQKRDNLFYLTLDEMRKAGEDPYEQYPESLFDVSQYPEFAGIATSGSPEEMRRETISGAVYNWRERNQDIVQQAYDAFLRSGLDYDDYKKRSEEGEPVEEEVVSVDVDADLTPQQTFEGLEEEQKIGRINDALEKNPNATLADILDILTTWNIPTDLFRKATGTTPEEYVGKGGAGTDNGTDGGDEGGGDGECQPGYEKWNGSCVPVCNAAAGYVRDEATGQCVLKETREEGQGGGNGDTEPKENGQQCPVGQVYDEALQKCVPIERKINKKDDEEPPVDLNEPVKQETILPQLPLTQEVTQEPESTTGMLAAALSPDRTTSEVLAPDLFKLDTDIPLIGRLTQSTPMAAPQYLLSGISQRYRV